MKFVQGNRNWEGFLGSKEKGTVICFGKPTILYYRKRVRRLLSFHVILRGLGGLGMIIYVVFLRLVLTRLSALPLLDVSQYMSECPH